MFMEEIRFIIKKIIYKNKKNGYTIAEVEFKQNNSEVYYKGNIVKGYFISIFKSDEYVGTGKWVKNKKYGYQFELSSYKKVLPVTEKGLIEFLSNNVEGIGKKTAERIVKFYKEESISKIKEGPDNLKIIPGIGEVRANKIYKSMIRHENFEETMLFFMQNGIYYKTLLEIYSIYEEDTLYKIKANPFILSELDNNKFYDADKMACNLKIPYDNTNRLKSFVLCFLNNKANKDGDLFVYEEELVNSFNFELVKKGAYPFNKMSTISKQTIRKIIDMLINEKKVSIDYDKNENKCIYLYRYYYMENKVVNKITKFIKTKTHPMCSASKIELMLKEYEKNNKVRLAKNQKEAIHMFNENRFSILTGGPGTGKTQIIKAIVEIIYTINSYAVIELAAPTGKASKRMSELTGLEAKTIHRLIDLKPNSDINEFVELDCDYLIVDESSMIDIYVFYKLLTSLKSNTRVLIVGDYDQLPSVGAGLVLRDLINSNAVPTTRLTEIFRQERDSQIILMSNSIVKGQKLDVSKIDNDKGDFYFIERSNIFEIQKIILYSIKRFLEKGYSMDEIQILSPMKKWELGTINLNRLIQSKFNADDKNEKFYMMKNGSILKKGDKVIQNVNNYDLEVFNGYVGTIIGIRKFTNDIEVIVDYTDSLVKYDYSNVDELNLAYSITVHKSQGSEFPVVIIPIHSSQSRMYNRNLIYTAVTRARDTAILIGEKEALNLAIEKEDNTKRNSLIKEKVSRGILDRHILSEKIV